MGNNLTSMEHSNPLDMMQARKRAYTLALRSPAGAEVLADLALFCRANATAFHPDPRVHAALEGRREVWLRIQDCLNLSPEEMFNLARPMRGGYPLKLATE